MKSFDVRRKKWFFLTVTLLVIAAGLLTFFAVGFGKGLVTDGGHMITMRLSDTFDFEETPKETIEGYILTLVGEGARLYYEDSQTAEYQILVVESETPFPYSKDSFLEAVNGEYEGLLPDDWTHFHTLRPSLTAADWLAIPIAVAIILLLLFIVIWLTIGIRSSFLMVIGALMSGLLSFSFLILLRFPAGDEILVAVAVSAAYSVVSSVSMLSRINRAADRLKNSDINTMVGEVTAVSKKPFFLYLMTCIAVFIVFVGVGLAFGADIDWFRYSAAVAVALFIPRFYSDILLPGFYLGR